MAGLIFDFQNIDAANFPAQTPRMAKKAAATTGRADLPVSRGEGEAAQQRRPTTKLKPSALLDTRVVYCGDNLEPIIKRSRKSSAS